MDDGRVILIATLGNRDLHFGGREFRSIPKDMLDEDILRSDIAKGNIKSDNVNISPRKGGKYFYENLDKYESKLSYPMIEKVIQKIVEREKKRIYTVILVATDQNEEVDQRDSDTIFFAKIIERMLKRKNKCLDSENKFMEQDPRVCKVTRNVVKVDLMMNFWEEVLKGKKIKNLTKGNVKVYVCPVGGIPAINTALLLSATKIFKTNCIHIYIDIHNQDPIISSFVKDMIFDIDREKLELSINRFDYAAAIEVLSKYNDYKYLVDLLEVAKNRLYFNLTKARSIIDKLNEERIRDIEIKEEAAKLYNEIKKIKEESKSKIKELYINARIKFEQEQYVDFLLRMFRLEEALKQVIVREELGINTEKDKRNGFKSFTEDICKNKTLQQYLDNYEVEGANLNWRDNVNNKVLEAIVDFVIEKGGNSIASGKYCEIKKASIITKQINVLSQLRNKSIAAHGFEEISKEKMENELEKKAAITFNDIFFKIEEYIGITFKDSPYHRLNRLIIKKLS